MNRVRKVIRPLSLAAGLAVLSLALSTNAMAESYRVIIKRVGPESTSGDIIVRIKPGKNENDFSGTAHVMLLGSNNPGTNRGLATLLTAITLGAEVIIDVPNPPSFDDVQVVTSMSLIAP